jgi:multiple sugar transport system substrate-binding protein
LANKMLLKLSVIALALLLLTCCARQEVVGTGKPADDKPVTLRLYQVTAFISDDEFQQFIVEPVKKKYPHITMELVRSDKDKSIDNLLAANDFPDMIFIASNSLNNVIKYNLPSDLNELVKKNNVNLNRFDKTAIEDIKAYSDKGELLALPFSTNFSIMLYNKDIFNKFGVPFPKDGMTWEEIIALAKTLERADGSTQYRGINPWDVRKFATPLSMPVVDPKTEKAAINSDGWKKAFQMMKVITDISNGNNKYPSFLTDPTLAMFTSYGDVFGDIEKQAKTPAGLLFDWDFTTMPSFQEAPGVGFRSLSHDLAISSTSQHKEDAFKVIQLLTSDEVQMAITKRGNRFPALDDQKLKDAYGVDNTILKGKNMPAIFKTKNAKNPKPTLYDDLTVGELNNAFSKVRDGKADINTALREAEEAANLKIAAEKVK